jgi:CRP-like cAMP-binding protein
MVSPELLRRFELFAGLTPREVHAVAMLAEEVAVRAGETVLTSGKPAEALYLLREGAAELYYATHDREIFISEINPGEPFGISALVEPYVYSGTVRARDPSRVLRIDALGLRELCRVDPSLSHGLLHEVARAALGRLHATEVLLGAAQS